MRGISKVYRMGEVEVHALRAVDLDLFRGEFVVILGLSGGGKSTLLNILGGLERVNRELGTTTAVITHNAAIAVMADRVIRLGSGQIIETRRNEKKASPAEPEW